MAKYKELPDDILGELASIGVEFDSNMQIDQGTMELLLEFYPDLIVPQQEMDPRTGEMMETFGPAVREATPTSKEWTPSKTEEVKANPGDLMEWANEMTWPQDGIFEYTAKGVGVNERGKRVPFTRRWKRKEKYTPNEEARLKQAFETAPGGATFGDLTFNVVGEAAPKLKYLKDKGLIDPNIDDKELMEDMALQPQLYNALAMGEDPKSLKNLTLRGGQVVGLPLRVLGAKAAPGDQDAPGELQKELARTGIKPGSGFWSSMAQGALKSPVAPATILAAPFTGGGSVMGNALRQTVLGAAENAVDMAAQEGMGAANYTSEDYIKGGMLGAGLGGLFSAPGVARTGLRKVQEANANPDTLLRRGSRDLMSEDAAIASRAQAQSKQLARDQYDLDELQHYADKWGVPAEELFPGLGLKSRKSGVISNLKRIVGSYPELDASWRETWDKLSDSVNELTGYQTAPTPAKAGGMAVDGMRAAENEMFDSLESSYSKVAENPELAQAVDEAIGGESGLDLYEFIVDMDSELQANFPTKIVDMGAKGKVEVPVGIDDAQYAAVQKMRKQLRDVAAVIEKYDEPGFQAGSGRVFSDIEKVRKLLSQKLKNQKNPDLDPSFKMPDLVERKVAKLYGKFRETIADAVEQVDPEQGKILRESNATQQTFFELREKARPALTKSGDTGVFNALWAEPERAKALSKAMGLYGQGETWRQIRNAWFDNTVLNRGSSGALGDKWAKALGKKQNKDFINQFYGPGVFPELERMSNTMLNMGDPRTLSSNTNLSSPQNTALGLSDVLKPHKLPGKIVGAMGGRKADIPDAHKELLASINRTKADALYGLRGGAGRAPESGVGVLKDLTKEALRTNPFLPLAHSPEPPEFQQNRPKNLWKDLAARR